MVSASSQTRNRIERTAKLCLWAAVALTIAWLAWSLAGRPGHAGRFFNVWIYDAAIFAAALTAVAQALAGRARWAWSLLGAGLGAWALANSLSYTSFGGEPAIGRMSWVDLCFLAALPLLLAGVAQLIRSRAARFPVAAWFDALAAGLATAAVALALLAPTLLAYDWHTAINEVTNVGYPFADLLLFGFLFGALATQGAGGSRSLWLVASGVLVWAAADVLFATRIAAGTYGPGTLDVLWPAGAVLIAAGAVAAATPEPDRRLEYRSPRGVAASSGIVAVTVLCLAGLGDVAAVAVVAAAASVLALIVRLVVVAREYDQLLGAVTDEASTDSLTGLRNRRKLLEDLTAHLAGDDPGERLLALFDLNGFKDYNDAFGHSAGDALLRRLGGNLDAAVRGVGTAYRLGGDEFCILCDPSARPQPAIIHGAHAALSESGEAFTISASGGHVRIPAEAPEAEEALRKADTRMYAEKRRSSRADRQTAGVLLRVLREREPALAEHHHSVADAAAMTAAELGMDAEGIDVVRRAAELHDVGKVAIPDEILHKPGPLDETETELMHSHTITGERILGSTQAMRPVAALVRSSHERWDGHGYPDGLAGEEIPLGARIIFVCDAFDAMTSDRPYQPSVDPAEALDELERHAGTQFDPRVVAAFRRSVPARRAPEWARERTAGTPEPAPEPPRDLR